MNDLDNLLYALHSTPVLDKLDLQTIAKKTKHDSVLDQIITLVNDGELHIPKDASSDLRKFEGIINELMVTPSGILLKGERIVLPQALQKKAIQLAHKGSHPGQAAMERRLRSHFFFHDMRTKVVDFLKTCIACPAFSSKKT